ncbi:MAG: HTH-type transcriptional regulator, glycine betaine synthesis regulator [Chloroflexota bacterium]|jgi:DNA-binding transcriptional regulator GbsR (MarR family)|nr:HTH-type transcriptional regulator, glycine betaine synthesis regulator [Chloroflexota bacterium]
MTSEDGVRATFVEGMGGIGEFWGIGKAMGQIWATLYLSQDPMTMDDLVREVGITKGHASTNLRALLRLGLVSKSFRPGDRKDYYTPQADLWAFARSVLRERQQQEFDVALASTSRSLQQLEASRAGLPAAEYRFLKARLDAVRDFHGTIDRAVNALLRLEDLHQAAVRLTSRRRSN